MSGRICKLNQAADARGSVILYIMARDQRTHDNHALLAAQEAAVKAKLPLVVGFIAYASSGYRAAEHFDFMYAGLIKVAETLRSKSIGFVVREADRAPSWRAVSSLADEVGAAALYFDFSPLRGPRRLQKKVAGELSDTPVYVVDTHNIVPVWKVSDKQEYAARTIRPKIHRLLASYLEAPAPLAAHPYAPPADLVGGDLAAVRQRIVKGAVPNGTVAGFASGEDAAAKALADFIEHRLDGYAEGRNDPAHDHLSGLSPYLHFGQLASLRVVLEAEAAASLRPGLRTDVDTLIEEMIVRKELSDNFCLHNDNYDSLNGAPEWAKKTLQKHAEDEREHSYTLQQLETAETHDQAWNAAQRQLTQTGKMHGYMRMYWAKKVLEWSPASGNGEREIGNGRQGTGNKRGSGGIEGRLSGLHGAAWAVEVLKYLNDFYSIDGGDPNGYVGILWSVAGVHDRPWGERAVFGSVRYMNYQGLKRKFDIAAYERQWS